MIHSNFISNFLFQNPVAMKELRGRMRGRRAFVVLTIYLLLMGLFIWVVYAAYAAAANTPGGPDPRQAGKVVFGAVLGIELFLVVLIGPAFTAGTISGEREKQTYDLLRTTLLPASRLVLGKLISALSYIFLLILASVPLQSIAFLLGGVSLLELVVSQLVIVVAAVTFAMLGMLFSSLMRSTLAASVTTYAIALFLTVVAPFIALIGTGIIGPILFSSPGTFSELSQVIAAYVGNFLAATNLPASLIMSEVLLLENDAIWYTTTAIGRYTLYIFSPWYLTIILYGLMSLLLYWATVRRVRRIES